MSAKRYAPYPGWGNARDDKRDMGALCVLLGPELRPVRPPRGEKPKARPGQLSWHLPL